MKDSLFRAPTPTRRRRATGSPEIKHAVCRETRHGLHQKKNDATAPDGIRRNNNDARRHTHTRNTTADTIAGDHRPSKDAFRQIDDAKVSSQGSSCNGTNVVRSTVEDSIIPQDDSEGTDLTESSSSSSSSSDKMVSRQRSPRRPSNRKRHEYEAWSNYQSQGATKSAPSKVSTSPKSKGTKLSTKMPPIPEHDFRAEARTMSRNEKENRQTMMVKPANRRNGSEDNHGAQHSKRNGGTHRKDDTTTDENRKKEENVKPDGDYHDVSHKKRHALHGDRKKKTRSQSGKPRKTKSSHRSKKTKSEETRREENKDLPGDVDRSKAHRSESRASELGNSTKPESRKEKNSNAKSKTKKTQGGNIRKVHGEVEDTMESEAHPSKTVKTSVPKCNTKEGTNPKIKSGTSKNKKASTIGKSKKKKKKTSKQRGSEQDNGKPKSSSKLDDGSQEQFNSSKAINKSLEPIPEEPNSLSKKSASRSDMKQQKRPKKRKKTPMPETKDQTFSLAPSRKLVKKTPVPGEESGEAALDPDHSVSNGKSELDAIPVSLGGLLSYRSKGPEGTEDANTPPGEVATVSPSASNRRNSFFSMSSLKSGIHSSLSTSSNRRGQLSFVALAPNTLQRLTSSRLSIRSKEFLAEKDLGDDLGAPIDATVLEKNSVLAASSHPSNRNNHLWYVVPSSGDDSKSEGKWNENIAPIPEMEMVFFSTDHDN